MTKDTLSAVVFCHTSWFDTIPASTITFITYGVVPGPLKTWLMVGVGIRPVSFLDNDM